MKLTHLPLVVLAVCFAPVGFSQPTEGPSASKPKHAVQLTEEALRNATYLIDQFEGPITLRNGQFAYPVDSLAEGEVAPFSNIEYWGASWVRLNRDSLTDAIVELQYNYGGTGDDHFLIPVLNKEGQPCCLKPYRIPFECAEVYDAEQRGRTIWITFTVYPPKGETDKPPRMVTYRFRFQKDHLEQIDQLPSSAP